MYFTWISYLSYQIVSWSLPTYEVNKMVELIIIDSCGGGVPHTLFSFTIGTFSSAAGYNTQLHELSQTR